MGVRMGGWYDDDDDGMTSGEFWRDYSWIIWVVVCVVILVIKAGVWFWIWRRAKARREQRMQRQQMAQSGMANGGYGQQYGGQFVAPVGAVGAGYGAQQQYGQQQGAWVPPPAYEAQSGSVAPQAPPPYTQSYDPIHKY